jgi:hypothetical protein
MALQIEGVVDRSVDREKALSRRLRFDTLRLPLASSNHLVGVHLVGVLRPVVLAFGVDGAYMRRPRIKTTISSRCQRLLGRGRSRRR